MNESTLVSIVTVSYNSANTIEDTLQSIAKQTYKNIEYILIDGKSSDDTVAKAEAFRSKTGMNMTIISEKDHGIYDAMNKGIGVANGELIGLVNSDDWLESDAVETMVTSYEEQKNGATDGKGNPYVVLYGMQRNYLDEKEKSTFIHHHDFLKDQMITHPTCFVTKATYEALGKFDTKYRSSADYDLMLRFWESKKVEFIPIHKIISNFRTGGMSSGQVGVRENAKMKYERGYISKKTYLFITVKSHLYEWSRGRK